MRRSLNPVMVHDLLPLPFLLEVGTVAHRLGMSPEFVRELIRKGKLPAKRFGRCLRVDAADVRAYIEHEQAPLGTLPPHPAVLRDDFNGSD